MLDGDQFVVTIHYRMNGGAVIFRGGYSWYVILFDCKYKKYDKTAFKGCLISRFCINFEKNTVADDVRTICGRCADGGGENVLCSCPGQQQMLLYLLGFPKV